VALLFLFQIPLICWHNCGSTRSRGL